MSLKRLCLLLTGLCNVAVAQEPPAVIVKGARYDQRREETASTMVLGREELDANGDRSLADALSRLPGITIGDGKGQGKSIRMRGMGAGYTQILLNGVPAPKDFEIESLAPELVERVEVVRSASAELGTQAIAGTINIILRKAIGRRSSESGANLDRQGGQWAPSWHGQLAGKQPGYSYLVGATLARTSEPEQRDTLFASGPAQAAANSLRSSVAHETNVADTVSLSPRLARQFDNGDALSVQGFASIKRRTVDVGERETVLLGQAGEFPEFATRFQSHALFLRSDLDWTHRLQAGASLNHKLGLSYSPRSADFVFTGAPATVRRVEAQFMDAAVTASGKLSLPEDDSGSASAGWDGAHSWRWQTRKEQQWGAGSLPETSLDGQFRGVVDRIALFAQREWKRDAWSVGTGLRWEALRTRVRDQTGQSVARSMAMASPILNALRKLPGNGQLRLALSRTYKAPTMTELIPRRYTIDSGNSPTNPDTQGNPMLRPERAWGLDASLDTYFGKDGMASVSAYARHIDDVTISRLFSEGGRWISAPFNDGAARMHGVALEIKMPLAAAWSLHANLARDWSVVQHLQAPGNRLARQLPLSANASVEYRHDALTLGVDLRYLSDTPARLSTFTVADGSDVRKVSVHAVWQQDQQRRWRLAIDNLLHQTQIMSTVYRDEQRFQQQTVATPGLAVVRLSFDYKW